MRHPLTSLILPAVLTLAAGEARAVPQPSPSQIDADVRAGSRGYELLKQLTDQIGPRMTGSDQGARAEQFAMDRFKASGFTDARFQPFAFQRWIRGPLSLTVGGEPVAAVAYGGSPARVSLSAELVDMGNGVEADYAAQPERVKGKVALISYLTLPGSPAGTQKLPRWEKLKLAIRHGAAGAVFINRGEGDILATGTGWLDGPIPVPAVMIGHDRGMALKAALAKSPMPVRIEMINEVGPGSARNIIATLPGRDPDAGTIVFGAHLDSWDMATGALDNGASAMTLLDVADLFKRNGYRPRRTIQFVLYMGEEQGDLGSNAQVKASLADGSIDKVGYMFNTDMSLDPVALNTWGWEVDKGFYAALATELRARQPKLSTETVDGPMPGGDSDPWLRAGVPILYLNGEQTPAFGRCQHSDCDRLDIVSPEAMLASARVEAIALYALADAEHLPAERLSGPKLDAYLDRFHLRP